MNKDQIKNMAERLKENLWEYLETAPGYDSEIERIKEKMNDLLDELDGME